MTFITIHSWVSLDRCDGNCITAEDSFDIIYTPNKIEDGSLKVFNMMKGIKE